jgi:hypothetical protein
VAIKLKSFFTFISFLPVFAFEHPQIPSGCHAQKMVLHFAFIITCWHTDLSASVMKL